MFLLFDWYYGCILDALRQVVMAQAIEPVYILHTEGNHYPLWEKKAEGNE